MKTFLFIVFFILAFAATAQPACAYLDPGMGSYIFQIIAGAFFAVAVAVTTLKNTVLGFFKKKPSKSDKIQSSDKTQTKGS